MFDFSYDGFSRYLPDPYYWLGKAAGLREQAERSVDWVTKTFFAPSYYVEVRGTLEASLGFSLRIGNEDSALYWMNQGASFNLAKLGRKYDLQTVYNVARQFFESKEIRRDPHSVFHPLFEALILCKNELGGRFESVDIMLDKYTKKRVNEASNKYRWMYQMFLGLQELAPTDRREFLRMINCPRSHLYSNPAVDMAIAMSGQVIHYEKKEVGGEDKVDIYIDLLLREFDAANSAPNRKEALLEFFKEAFDMNGRYFCFDHRLSTLEKYASRRVLNSDFLIDLKPGMGAHQKTWAYFEAFRNLQIDEMANREKQKYSELRPLILKEKAPSFMVDEGRTLRSRFYIKYCNMDLFQKFLRKEKAPESVFEVVRSGDFDDYLNPP